MMTRNEQKKFSQDSRFIRKHIYAILLGFNAGIFARRAESWSDQQIVDSAMTTLRTIVGTNIPVTVHRAYLSGVRAAEEIWDA